MTMLNGLALTTLWRSWVLIWDGEVWLWDVWQRSLIHSELMGRFVDLFNLLRGFAKGIPYHLICSSLWQKVYLLRLKNQWRREYWRVLLFAMRGQNFHTCSLPMIALSFAKLPFHIVIPYNVSSKCMRRNLVSNLIMQKLLCFLALILLGRFRRK